MESCLPTPLIVELVFLTMPINSYINKDNSICNKFHWYWAISIECPGSGSWTHKVNKNTWVCTLRCDQSFWFLWNICLKYLSQISEKITWNSTRSVCTSYLSATLICILVLVEHVPPNPLHMWNRYYLVYLIIPFHSYISKYHFCQISSKLVY